MCKLVRLDHAPTTKLRMGRLRGIAPQKTDGNVWVLLPAPHGWGLSSQITPCSVPTGDRCCNHMTGLVSSLLLGSPFPFTWILSGISIVKYVWVWVSAPLCSCVVLHREMILLVSVYSVGGRGYEVTLLLQNRQDMLLELHLGSWDGDLYWPGDP